MIAFFFLNSFDFETEKLNQLLGEMSERDCETFNFNHRKIDFKEWTKTSVYGTRKFVLKDKDETLADARKKLKFLKILHNVLVGIIFLVAAQAVWIPLFLVSKHISHSY